MNAILVQQMAHYKMDTFDREADSARLVALAKTVAVPPIGVRELFKETAGRVRLIGRHVGA